MPDYSAPDTHWPEPSDESGDIEAIYQQGHRRTSFDMRTTINEDGTANVEIHGLDAAHCDLVFTDEVAKGVLHCIMESAKDAE